MTTGGTNADGKLLLVSPSPHVHAPDTIRSIMRDVVLALLPAAVASVCIFGVRALVLIATCVGTCVLGEHLARKAMGRPSTVGDLSAVVTGLLLAFCLPPGFPPWMAAVGSLFAIVVCKQLFGGLGYNPFNPALAARAFLLVSFTGAMTTWTSSTWTGVMADAVTHATTRATPLAIVKAAYRAGRAVPFTIDGAMTWRFFLGDMNGCIGETCTLALLAGAAYLLVRKVITWHIPVAYIGTVMVYAAILRLACPTASMPVRFHVLTGGLVLGAFFMATDMVTSPTTPRGQVVFGVGCGVLTMVIRTVLSGDYPEGVSFAILIMNAFVPLIDRATRVKPFGGENA